MSDKHGIPTGKHTLVEEGTEFHGTLSSKCPIVVMGKVEGEVHGPAIHVTPSGVVAGKVVVVQLHSDGEVAGEVEADSVRISGKVRDNTVIRARTLEVSLAAQQGSGMQVVFGACELAIGDAPNKEAAIAAATAPPASATAPVTVPVTVQEAPAAASPAGTGKPGKKGGPTLAATPTAEPAPAASEPRARSGTQPPPAG